MDYLITHLRTIYTAQRSLAYLQETGFTSVPAKFRRPEWEAAVKFFLQHHLNFQRCVKARFDQARQSGQRMFHVHPNSLASAKYLKLYNESCRTLLDEIEAEYDSQRLTCRDYLLTTAYAYGFPTKTQALRYTLFNDAVQLSNLFRYCLAHSERLHDVAEHYEEAAMAQYLLAPREYDQAWKDCLPEGFRQRAINMTGGLLHD